MNRLTRFEEIYGTDIHNRLQAFENIIEGFEVEVQSLEKRMEALKLSDKTKTITYKETLGRKVFLRLLLEELKKADFLKEKET